VVRENVIDRTYDQQVGSGTGFAGVDYPSCADRSAMLIDYLGLSEPQLVNAMKRMIADGK